MPTLNKQRSDSGFTLVEILVIAPIIVIMIAVLITVMVTMVGEMLKAREQNRLSLEVNNALQEIDHDIHLSTQMLRTTGSTDIPMGSNENTAPFNSGVDYNATYATLVTSQLGLTEKPESPTRSLIYYQNTPTSNGDCSAKSIADNNVYKINVVYYVRGTTLVKRTIMPPYNTNTDNTLCALPWQKNSCLNPSTPGDKCYVSDTELVKNVTGFKVKYFLQLSDTSPTSVLSQIDKSKAAEVTISAKTSVAGEDVKRTSTIRSTTINAK